MGLGKISGEESRVLISATSFSILHTSFSMASISFKNTVYQCQCNWKDKVKLIGEVKDKIQ